MDEFVDDLGHVGRLDLVISKIRFFGGKLNQLEAKPEAPTKVQPPKKCINIAHQPDWKWR